MKIFFEALEGEYTRKITYTMLDMFTWLKANPEYTIIKEDFILYSGDNVLLYRIWLKEWDFGKE